MANTVWCALTLIQQREDEIFIEFLLYRNIVGQWQIKTHNTQKLETTATVQQGCLDTAGWLQQHRNADHNPASSLCHWPQMLVPLVYKGGIFQLGLTNANEKKNALSLKKHFQGGLER